MLGSFVFSYAADKQTNKQTVWNVLPMPTDIVGVGNYAWDRHVSIRELGVANICSYAARNVRSASSMGL